MILVVALVGSACGSSGDGGGDGTGGDDGAADCHTERVEDEYGFEVEIQVCDDE